MTDPTNPLAPREASSEDLARTQKRRDTLQLAACTSDLVDAITEHVDWLLATEAEGRLRSAEEMDREPFGPVEAHQRARQPLSYGPGRTAGEGFAPEQVSWFQLSRLIEHEPAKGRDLWGELKGQARKELATGVRAGEAMEPRRGTPWGRAQYLAVVDALIDDLKPRGAVELLLIHRMSATFEMSLRWQRIAVQRMEEAEWQGESDRRRALEGMTPAQRERHQQYEGWLPPRITTAEAIQQAGLMADRYERAFLRLVRAFRDYRRHHASIIVAGAGHQVNIGEQQINLHTDDRE